MTGLGTKAWPKVRCQSLVRLALESYWFISNTLTHYATLKLTGEDICQHLWLQEGKKIIYKNFWEHEGHERTSDLFLDTFRILFNHFQEANLTFTSNEGNNMTSHLASKWRLVLINWELACHTKRLTKFPGNDS